MRDGIVQSTKAVPNAVWSEFPSESETLRLSRASRELTRATKVSVAPFDEVDQAKASCGRWLDVSARPDTRALDPRVIDEAHMVAVNGRRDSGRECHVLLERATAIVAPFARYTA